MSVKTVRLVDLIAKGRTSETPEPPAPARSDMPAPAGKVAASVPQPASGPAPALALKAVAGPTSRAVEPARTLEPARPIGRFKSQDQMRRYEPARTVEQPRTYDPNWVSEQLRSTAVVNGIELLAIELLSLSKMRKDNPRALMIEALRSIDSCLVAIGRQH